VDGAPGRKAVHVDDVEAVPWLGTELTWRPVRQTLGAQIVGIAAFTAERAGQEIVEGHSEVTRRPRSRGGLHRAARPGAVHPRIVAMRP
jgi:hypothetical protein